MPKLENFETHIKIDGNPFAKNAINYQVHDDDSVGLYYTNQRDRRILDKTLARFDDWTDLNDTPYTSFELLISDLDNFLFDTLRLESTAFGEQTIAELTPIFRGSFEFTVDNTELTTNQEENDGTVTQADGMAVVASSITVGGHAHIGSRQKGKYRSGAGGNLRWTMLFETPGAAGAEMYGGYVDEHGSSAVFKNGYTIGYTGTQLGIQRWRDDALVEEVIQSAWDKPLLSGRFILDTSKLNVYQIQFQYLGAGAINFCVEDPETSRLIIFHTIKYANSDTIPSIINPNGHWTLHVTNATAVDLIMKSSSYAYFVEGKTNLQELHQPQFASGTKEKTTVTAEVAIFTIRNKSTYASKTNFIDVLLQHFSSAIEANSANNIGTIRLVKNATLGGVPAFNDINTTDSVIDIDIAGTTVTNGKELLAVSLAGKNDRIFENLEDLEIILQPTETLTLAGLSANSATMNGELLWKELF